MKKGFAIVLLVCAARWAASCSKTKSYTDYLNEEKDVIERLIDEKGFEILKDFPADTVFKENQFVKLENGVYLNGLYRVRRRLFIVALSHIRRIQLMFTSIRPMPYMRVATAVRSIMVRTAMEPIPTP